MIDGAVETAGKAPPTPVQMPIEVVFHRFRPMTIVLLGAGGTGARLGPDITRLLSRDDRLFIMDHDRVEERNLTRQHFTRSDVGKYKAEVVARRCQIVAGAGVAVEPMIQKFTGFTSLPGTRSTRIGDPIPNLIIGAVDTRECRRAGALAVLGQRALWIDVGNELRGGQVGMWGGWPVDSIQHLGTGERFPSPEQLKLIKENLPPTADEAAREHIHLNHGPWVEMNTIAEITPAILRPDPEAEKATEACAIRLDTQSLAANVMAYCSVINLVSRILDGLPVSSGAAFFSTANTMTPKPFKYMAKAGGGDRVVVLSVERPLSDRVALQRLVQSAVGEGR